ncbi:MAG TPA: mechanosensitive ion channel domain-containing protein [Alphaproteobacteria bacterium]|nr:mechanosensitive ion channel domain-containing protein [Alphaproteobacteria bacterium]
MPSNPYMIALLAAVSAVALHGAVILVRHGLQKVFAQRSRTNAKARTLVSLAASTAEFCIYFVALGFILAQFGVSLTTYLASASIIGLAVAFGSQGLVQDVVTGLTILVADVFNVGDMLEVAGQVGIVEDFGMRFTLLRNANGALVYVPNRNIAAVTKYPRRHVRCHVDVALPDDGGDAEALIEIAERAAKSAIQQWPAIFLRPPTFDRIEVGEPPRTIFRITFRIWPGRGGPLEGSLRQELLHRMKAVREDFADWRISINTEIEVRTVQADLLARARGLLNLSN